MTAFLLIFLCQGVLGQHGFIAYIIGPTPAEYRLTVVNVETGRMFPIGQGDSDAYPQWAPDGRRIAYQSKQPDGTGIRIAYPFEERDEGLKHRSIWNHKPQWSPCGKMLAYSSGDATSPLECITVLDIETGVETIWGGEQRGFLAPVWLPSLDLMKALDPETQDSPEIHGLEALKTEAASVGMISATGITGTPPRLHMDLFLLTPSSTAPLLSLLSPDSERYVKYNVRSDHKARQISYESNEGGDRELFVLNRRGIINISNHPAADWNPVWSPDDTWLVFESFRGGHQGVYRVLVSTGNVMPVAVGDNYECWAPDWSPDNEWLVFVSNMQGIPQLFLIRPDGSEMKQLTFGESPALSPVWQPSVRNSQE